VVAVVNAFYVETPNNGGADAVPEQRAAEIAGRRLAGAGLVVRGDEDWALLPRWLAALRAQGLRLFALSVTVDARADRLDPSLDRAIEQLAGGPTLIELTLVSGAAHDAPSAPRAAPSAAKAVTVAAKCAAAARLRVSLRPRCGCWLQRIDDAVRIAMRVNRPDVGVTFSEPDWRTCDTGTLDARLQLAAPRLFNLIVNDASALPTVRPMLNRLGYAGPIGFMTLQVDSN